MSATMSKEGRRSHNQTERIIRCHTFKWKRLLKSRNNYSIEREDGNEIYAKWNEMIINMIRVDIVRQVRLLAL